MLKDILGSQEFIVRNYIDKTIQLVKSINIINVNEAKLFNTYLENNYSDIQINKTDMKSWRYYKHLLGEKYYLDEPLYVVSVDNLQTIELTRSNLNIHTNTKLELLKFGEYYNNVINKYPYYNLYLKAIITDKLYTIDDIVKLPNGSIVSYNKTLIEENELDLINHLQDRINNYKDIWNLTYYAMSDSLFLAAQISIFYNFILTSLLSLRLKNAKTIRANSFHIRNYLSSHHYLDKHYNYLTKDQSLYLYRNLLYLDNRSGDNFVFTTLIKKLFIDRNISISRYNYKMINDLDTDRSIEYRFNKDFFFNTNKDYYNYTLDDIIEKENKLLVKNSFYNEVKYKAINDKFKNCLNSSYFTKNLETLVYDYTDNVKYKILDTIIDHLAYICKENKGNFQISINNSSNTKSYILDINDSFKLLLFLIYKMNKINLEEFPSYLIKRVRKEILPDTSDILKYFYKPKYYHIEMIDDIKNNSIPLNTTLLSNISFYNYVKSIYTYNMGLWFYTSNLSEKDDEGQMLLAIDKLHKSYLYEITDENIDQFLNRLSLEEIKNYDINELSIMFTNLINIVFGNKYKELFNLEFIQKSMLDIFKKFKSYTTQLVTEYYINNITLSGIKSNRYSISTNEESKLFFHQSNRFTIDHDVEATSQHNYNFNSQYNKLCSFSYKHNIDITSELHLKLNNKIVIPVNIKTFVVHTDIDEFLVNPSSQDDLLYLLENSD